MTYYRWIQTDNLIDENSLEGVALMLKRTRNEIDSLAVAYDRAQDALSGIMERQKEASAAYKDLKEKLVKLAEEEDEKSE